MKMKKILALVLSVVLVVGVFFSVIVCVYWAGTGACTCGTGGCECMDHGSG